MYKAPKSIVNHKGVHSCDYGPDSGCDYKHDVWLKDGWRFESGRMAGCQGGHFDTVEDFKYANPVEV